MAGKKRPNLIMFIPDRWHGKKAGCLGNPDVQTPNADRLAAEGVAFSNCYVQHTASSASRCSFMTGWYPHVRGHRTHRHMLSSNEPFLLRQLKDQGYYVWWGGKNDVIREEEQADACTERYLPEAESGSPAKSPETSAEEGLASSQESEKGEAGAGRSFNDALMNGAVGFLQSLPPEPFCLCLTLYGQTEEPDCSSIHPGGTLHASTDAALGRLLDALRDSGRWGDSAIFAFGARGEDAGASRVTEEAGRFFEDERTNVPLLIKYPVWLEVPKRSEPVDALVELIDFYATAAELAELPERHTHFGNSLVPLSQGLASGHRSQVFCESGALIEELGKEPADFDGRRPEEPFPNMEAYGKSVMLRTERWKYVRRLYGKDELYDLTCDPEELRDAAADAAYASVRREMVSRMTRWFMETVDVVPYEPVMHKLEGKV